MVENKNNMDRESSKSLMASIKVGYLKKRSKKGTYRATFLAILTSFTYLCVEKIFKLLVTYKFYKQNYCSTSCHHMSL